jgi:hypothetical protein
VPFIDARYRTDARREKRGIQGKSSGGYGALVTPILRPDLFSALACHCGDSLFEAYLADFLRPSARPRGVRGPYDRWWRTCGQLPARRRRTGTS